jgi:hypothetical protein
MKKYLIFAASALALASCSSDDFLGENPGNVQNATTAINFGGEAGKITRATSNEGDDHVKLGNEFKVYGVKKTNDKMFHNVFIDYSVCYDETLTTSNTNKWEYVGKNNQTIKYWDYSASEYRFVAGSPIDAFIYNKDLENISTTGTVITSATVKGLAGHIKANKTETALEANPVYVAEPKVVPKDDYKNTVQFNFVRQQSMVRVGFYETIPGYKITKIEFYKADATKPASKNIILYSSEDDYFVGGTNVSGTVKYNWTATTPSYTFEYIDNENLKKDKNWYAGELSTLAETSTGDVAELYGTDKDMSATTGYFTVLPTQLATASPILIKCDYELTSDDGSSETINVTGATAAIPAAFSKWEANTRYTYLFKISDNTNGTTGTPGSTDPTGLFPITFDAVVQEVEQGTTTTVSTPSITTYQAGSVTDKGIEYKTGEPIYATVYDQETRELKDLTTSGDVQVYKLNQERTEAELQIATIFATEITNNTPLPVTVPTTSTTVGNVTLDANKYLSFKPTEAGYYAIKYKYAADTYKYKVIKVVAPTPAH